MNPYMDVGDIKTFESNALRRKSNCEARRVWRLYVEGNTNAAAVPVDYLWLLRCGEDVTEFACLIPPTEINAIHTATTVGPPEADSDPTKDNMFMTLSSEIAKQLIRQIEWVSEEVRKEDKKKGSKKQADLRLRLLIVPAHHLHCLWLQSDSNNQISSNAKLLVVDGPDSFRLQYDSYTSLYSGKDFLNRLKHQ